MNQISILEELLPDVFLVNYSNYSDERGDFDKYYSKKIFSDAGIQFAPQEFFLTKSKKYVLRGMHFQVAHAAHDKLVFCIKGNVLDVVVDIRPDSPHFNKPISVNLSDDNSTGLFIGKGYAHGFLALADDTWMLYATSTIHAPALDKGILWSSIDFDWPLINPIVSPRDNSHPAISEY